MNPKYSLIVVLILLLVSGAIILVNNPEGEVSLSSVMELASDAQKTVAKPVEVVTQMSDEAEVDLGNKLARSFVRNSFNKKTEQHLILLEKYIQKIGKSLLPGVTRKKIVYKFYLIKNPTINAFAMPGGHICIFTGLVEFAKSEAELAFVLGHEITHVDAKHCVKKYQSYTLTSKLAGPFVRLPFVGRALAYANLVMYGGYQKFHEFEADAGGLKLACRAGYDPREGNEVMKRMGKKFEKKPRKIKAKNPISELSKAISVANDSYFRSHPPTLNRTKKMAALCSKLIKNKTKLFKGIDKLKQIKIKKQP